MAQKGLERTAKVRTAVISLFKSRPEDEFTLAQLMTQMFEVIAEVEYKDSNLYSVLTGMIKNKQISVRREGTMNFYSAYKNGRAKAVAAKPTPPETPAQLTVDIVKATGRVRLTFQGLTVEIGVVET